MGLLSSEALIRGLVRSHQPQTTRQLKRGAQSRLLHASLTRQDQEKYEEEGYKETASSPSRDMTNEAGPSQTSSNKGKLDGLADDFAAALERSKSSPPRPPRSIKDSLTFSNTPRASRPRPFPRTDSFSSPRPSLPIAGKQPKERQSFNSILSDIFNTLELDPKLKQGAYGYGSGFGYGYGRDGVKTGFGYGYGSGLNRKVWDRNADNRRRKLEEWEQDEELMEELGELKEEIMIIQTDLELVDWAKRRVFTPLQPKGTENAKSDVDPTETTPAIPTDIVFSKTYPLILAHLLRVVRENFNNPHLALSFFLYAQTHSVESYLSGCLAPAYNQLIQTRWECFRDFRGVNDTIREMEGNAVGWDKNTQKVVSKVVADVGQDVLQLGEREAEEKWGSDVRDILERLEQKVEQDVRHQERRFRAKHQEVKRQVREELGWDTEPHVYAPTL